MVRNEARINETWRVDRKLHAWAKEAAKSEERSINYMVTRAMREMLERDYPDKRPPDTDAA